MTPVVTEVGCMGWVPAAAVHCVRHWIPKLRLREIRRTAHAVDLLYPTGDVAKKVWQLRTAPHGSMIPACTMSFWLKTGSMTSGTHRTISRPRRGWTRLFNILSRPGEGFNPNERCLPVRAQLKNVCCARPLRRPVYADQTPTLIFRPILRC